MSALFYVSYGALWLLLLVIAALLFMLYRHFGMMSLGTLEGVQRDGLPVGSVAKAISGVTADGKDVAWEPRHGQPHLLVFATPDCEPCRVVLPYVNRLAKTISDDKLQIAAVVPGPREEVARLVDQYDPPYLCLGEDGSGAFPLYRVRVTPFGFVVGADGRVLAKGLISDPARLRDLLESGGVQEAAAAIPLSSQPLTLTSNGTRVNGDSSRVPGEMVER